MGLPRVSSAVADEAISLLQTHARWSNQMQNLTAAIDTRLGHLLMPSGFLENDTCVQHRCVSCSAYFVYRLPHVNSEVHAELIRCLLESALPDVCIAQCRPSHLVSVAVSTCEAHSYSFNIGTLIDELVVQRHVRGVQNSTIAHAHAHTFAHTHAYACICTHTRTYARTSSLRTVAFVGMRAFASRCVLRTCSAAFSLAASACGSECRCSCVGVSLSCCVCVLVSSCVPPCLCPCLFVCPRACLSVSVGVSLSLSACPCVSLCLSGCLSVSRCLCVSSCVQSCVSAFLSLLFVPLAKGSANMAQAGSLTTEFRKIGNCNACCICIGIVIFSRVGGNLTNSTGAPWASVLSTLNRTIEGRHMEGPACVMMGMSFGRNGREKGRALPGPRSLVPLESDQMVPPPVVPFRKKDTLGFACAGPDMCRWGNLRSRGVVPSNFEIQFQIGRPVQSIGHFRCSGGPAVQILPRTNPSKRPCREGRGGAAQPMSPERRLWPRIGHALSDRKEVRGKVPPSAALDGGNFNKYIRALQIPWCPIMKRGNLYPIFYFFDL